MVYDYGVLVDGIMRAFEDNLQRQLGLDGIDILTNTNALAKSTTSAPSRMATSECSGLRSFQGLLPKAGFIISMTSPWRSR